MRCCFSLIQVVQVVFVVIVIIFSVHCWKEAKSNAKKYYKVSNGKYFRWNFTPFPSFAVIGPSHQFCCWVAFLFYRNSSKLSHVKRQVCILIVRRTMYTYMHIFCLIISSGFHFFDNFFVWFYVYRISITFPSLYCLVRSILSCCFLIYPLCFVDTSKRYFEVHLKLF